MEACRPALVNAHRPVENMPAPEERFVESVSVIKGVHPELDSNALRAAHRFLFVPDLGTDKIEIYQIDHGTQSITPPAGHIGLTNSKSTLRFNV